MASDSETRPWGCFEVLLDEPGYKVKRITLWPGQMLSLQRHARRSEYWTVVRGRGEVHLGATPICWPISAPETFLVPIGTWHRLANNEPENLVIIEVQIGDCDEDDIERAEDIYGRA